MSKPLTSRERLLATIDRRPADYAPCCFMIFSALQSQCRDGFEFARRQLELGLDATVNVLSGLKASGRAMSEQGDLWGLPAPWNPRVRIRDWREERPGDRYPLLHREYVTPGGALHTTVTRTEDWVQGDRVPLFDDFVIPRATKRLVARHEDLEALRYLLAPPTDELIAQIRPSAAAAKAFAAEHGVLIAGGWGSVGDTACWLAGMAELVLKAVDEPDFVEDLFGLIEAWNRQRMTVFLEAGVELFVRRGWYESSDLWSPALYRRFILPTLRRDVELAHQAGARFAYIMTSGQVPLLELLAESGIDVLIGLDPVQGKGTNFRTIKERIGSRVALWGGVNGFVTVELGSEEDVRAEVRRAFAALGPGGGFILSPVDNVTANTDIARRNITALIDEWRHLRSASA